MKHRVGFTLLLLATAFGCSSDGPPSGMVDPETPTGSIQGVVVDAAGEPLAGASVSVFPQGRTVQTDARGEYVLGPLTLTTSPRTYLIEIALADFDGVTREVSLSTSQVTARVDAVLLPVEPPPPGVRAGLDVRVSSVDQVHECVVQGQELVYDVDIRNRAGEDLDGVVLQDTLRGALAGPVVPGDVTIDRDVFPDAVLEIHPDGRSFSVFLGELPESATEYRRAYSVRAIVADREAGVYCNAATARGTGSDGPYGGRDQGCIVQLAVLLVDLLNEDGARVGGAFDPTPEVFSIGDGSAEAPSSLVYQVVVTNGHCFPFEDVRVVDLIVADTGSVVFGDVVAGFPTRGVVTSTHPAGFTWEVGTLPAGETAEIQFRAEAVSSGRVLNRVTLDVGVTPVIDEEVTIVD